MAEIARRNFSGYYESATANVCNYYDNASFLSFICVFQKAHLPLLYHLVTILQYPIYLKTG